MSAPVSIPSGDSVASKPKKIRKPKAVAAVADENKSNLEGTDDAKSKVQRRARFDPFVPLNFLNLAEVWNYRFSQRRSLNKMKLKLEQTEDANERSKLLLNIHRNEQNLEQLEEHMKDIHNQLRLVVDLSKEPGLVKLVAKVLDGLKPQEHHHQEQKNSE